MVVARSSTPQRHALPSARAERNATELRGVAPDEQPLLGRALDTLHSSSISPSLALQKALQPVAEGSDVASRAFEAYVQVRLARLPAADKARVEDLLSDAVRVKTVPRLCSTNSGSFARYDSEGGHFELRFPRAWQRSPTYFFSLAHELEHAIQDLTLERLGPPPALPSLRYQLELKHRKELGAMIAESNFLRLLPASTLAAEAERLRTHPDLDDASRGFLVRAFQSAPLDARAYVQAEHAAGRYSRRSMWLPA